MKSEILLLTKSHHGEELRAWLHWHLNIICADCIKVFDNESSIDIKAVCSEFGNRVEYSFIKGWPYQQMVYNNALKSNDGFKWCITLDDDEYLYIGDKYGNTLNNLISSLEAQFYSCRIFYIMWLNMFSKERIADWHQPYITTHTYYSYEACHNLYKIWLQGNGYGKSLINLDYKWDFTRGLHIPICLGSRAECFTVNGDPVKQHNLNPIIFKSEDEEHSIYGFNPECFIAHYQFKTFEDWKIKCMTRRATDPFTSIHNKVNVYNELYKYTDTFKECTLLKDMYEANK